MERNRPPYVDDLPAETLQAIGQLMVSTSLLEHLLRATVGFLRGMDLKQTRTELGAKPWGESMRDLRRELATAGVEVEQIDLLELTKTIRRVFKVRDLVAHCVWQEKPDGGHPMLTQTKGGRTDGHGSRAHLPESTDITAALMKAARDAGYAAQEAQRVFESLEESAGSRSRPAASENDHSSFSQTATPSTTGSWASFWDASGKTRS